MKTPQLPTGCDPRRYIMSRLAPGEICAQTPSDKLGLVFQVRLPDGRIQNQNAMVLYALAHNPQLDNLRNIRYNLERTQRLRLAYRQKSIAETKADSVARLLSEQMVKAERKLERLAARELESVQIWRQFMSPLPGLGIRISLALVAEIVTPCRFPNSAHLISYAGYGLQQGTVVKPTLGRSHTWQPRLKSALRMLAIEFIKRQGTYRDAYVSFKQREQFLNSTRALAKQLTPIHVEHRVYRRVIKQFLKDLYRCWTALEATENYNPSHVPISKPNHSASQAALE
jgi:hypothetical protein